MNTIMEKQENQESYSSLPVLPRLDRLDRLLQLLEEKHSLSGRHLCKTQVQKAEEKEDQCKTVSSALEEVQHKGTLMERLAMLENRVLQLCLEMDGENTSKSSSSTVPGSEKLDHGFLPLTEKQEKNEIMILQGMESPLSVKDQDSANPCDVKKKGQNNSGRQSKKAYRKWQGWLRVGCCSFVCFCIFCILHI